MHVHCKQPECGENRVQLGSSLFSPTTETISVDCSESTSISNFWIFRVRRDAKRCCKENEFGTSRWVVRPSNSLILAGDTGNPAILLPAHLDKHCTCKRGVFQNIVIKELRGKLDFEDGRPCRVPSPHAELCRARMLSVLIMHNGL